MIVQGTGICWARRQNNHGFDLIQVDNECPRKRSVLVGALQSYSWGTFLRILNAVLVDRIENSRHGTREHGQSTDCLPILNTDGRCSRPTEFENIERCTLRPMQIQKMVEYIAPGHAMRYGPVQDDPRCAGNPQVDRLAYEIGRAHV